jgi:hypothetical protein
MFRTQVINRDLRVLTVISNPIRYKSRYALYRDFAKHMEESGVELFTVELAYGDRPWEVTSPTNPHHIQLRTSSEIWHKENMMDIGVRHIMRLCPDTKAIAWIDADVQFVRKDWVEETWHALQHHRIVQLFSDAVDLGPDFQPIQTHRGFAWCYVTHQPYRLKHYPFWHPGYAWAARVETLSAMGGFIDKAVLGAGDHHMALAWIGRGADSLPGGIHPNYRRMVLDYQTLAEINIKRDIGFVPGTLLHRYHGKKKDRKYVERWKILIDNQYDPQTDVRYDLHSVLTLNETKIVLRDQIREYFRQRNEDSIDLE